MPIAVCPGRCGGDDARGQLLVLQRVPLRVLQPPVRLTGSPALAVRLTAGAHCFESPLHVDRCCGCGAATAARPSRLRDVDWRIGDAAASFVSLRQARSRGLPSVTETAGRRGPSNVRN